MIAAVFCGTLFYGGYVACPSSPAQYKKENTIAVANTTDNIGKLLTPLMKTLNSLDKEAITAASSAAILAASPAVQNALTAAQDPDIKAAQDILDSDQEVVSSLIKSQIIINTMGNTVTELAKRCKKYSENYSGMVQALERMAATPQLDFLHNQMLSDVTAMDQATKQYVADIADTWRSSARAADMAGRSMAAQNVAVLKLIPNYRRMDLPRGAKTVINSLSRSAAEKLIQTDRVLFDPKDKTFYSKALPKQPITASSISVAEGALELFSDITLSELIGFESSLYDNPAFACTHPVGRKIFEIMQGWTDFVSFENITYFHARSLNGNPYLDQEMLKAPMNVVAHGRYNEIGRSCYYVAETREGALSEIRKHSGNTKPTIQIAEIRPVKSARLIDLSAKLSKKNNFIEHLRFTVDNTDGKIIKEYLLPNYVASCCKQLGIDGIRYRSGSYNCCVTWKDDYFSFVSREIVEP